MMRAIAGICFTTLLCISHLNAQWTPANGPNGGCVGHIIAIKNTLFVATSENGIFKSTSAGFTWQPASAVFANQPMGSLYAAFGILFANQANGTIYSSRDSGSVWKKDTVIPSASGKFLNVGSTLFLCGESSVLKSLDSGRTWKPSNNGLGSGTIRTICQSANYILVGMYGGGVYRSSDLGNTWSEANNGLTDKRVYAVGCNNGMTYATSDGHNVYASSNDGSSWIKVSLFPSIVGFCLSGNTVYAYGEGIFSSIDSGATWKQINVGMNYGTYVTNLMVNAGSFYASTCGGGVYVSRDNGSTWSRSSDGLNNQYVEQVTTDGCTLYATTPYAMYSDHGTGGQWTESVFGSWGHWASTMNGTLYCGIQGFSRSNDNGSSWVIKNSGLSSYQTVSLVKLGGDLMLATASNGIFSSSNNGDSWQQIPSTVSHQVQSLFVDSTSMFICSPTEGVLRSSNHGLSWTPLDSGFSGLNIRCMIRSGSSLFAAQLIGGGQVYKSTNNGISWAKVLDRGVNTSINALLEVNGSVYAATESGVVQSKDGGLTWSDFSGGLERSVLSLTYRTPYIYAGTEYRSVSKRSICPIELRPLKKYVYCQGDSISIPFVINDSIGAGNLVTVELSDKSGSFDIPLLLGSKKSQVSDTIRSVVPKNLAPGSGYIYRVTISNPSWSVASICNSIVVHEIPSPKISASSSFCENTEQTLTVSGTTGSTFVWEVVSGNAQIRSGTGTNSIKVFFSDTTKSQIRCTETNQNNCSSSTIYMASPKPLPHVYNILGGGLFCEDTKGAQLRLSGSQLTCKYSVYRSGSLLAADKFGTGDTLDLGLYTLNGLYSVVAVDTSSGCTKSMLGDVWIGSIRVPAKPVISVNSVILSIVSSDEIQWFKNGVPIASANTASYTCTEEGTYSVQTMNRGCLSKMSDTVHITMPTKTLRASFSAKPTVGMAPLAVNFVDLSIGNVVTRIWNFGDSTTSTDKNPSHVYPNPGTYTVRLIVSDGVVYDTLYQSDYIRVSPLTDVKDFGSTSTSRKECMQLYPNPVANEVTVVLDQGAVLYPDHLREVSAVVVNLLGERVASFTLRVGEVHKLDVDHLGNGVYSIQLLGASSASSPIQMCGSTQFLIRR